MVSVYVLDVPEFRPIVDGARHAGLAVEGPIKGYFVLTHDSQIVLSRKALRLQPAIWYSALSGGVRGEVVQFDRDTLRIIGVDAALPS